MAVTVPAPNPRPAPAGRGGHARGATPSRTSRWIYVVFLGGLGALFAWHAWSQANAYWALDTHGQRAEAVILRYEEVRGRRSTSWYPVFQFATPEGLRVEATSGVPAEPAAWPRGRRVIVVYEPGNPTHVRPAAAVDAGPGVTPWILGLMAFVMFALASVFLIPDRPRKIH
ncbi:DUF3592 domain-containing protein [Roseomonas eburnea]|uniref:DUF3592 domain-containing protein n=1 Tax=Neoroseomonas eburnea TaxID=1346889 RepID=A0A9X9X8P2_9PROT|nr:DUF3592 domain-containing protein [Neoroseomonas eburnea]MBR0680078.1 DUF3592 domain-containing protein [Neoroseomonas eburnea]